MNLTAVTVLDDLADFFVCLGRAGVSACPRLEVMNSSKINKLGVYPREKRKC